MKSSIKRIEVYGDNVTFYFKDSNEPFSYREFIEGSETHTYLSSIQSLIRDYNEGVRQHESD
jgi:hypothetical protein